jgi:hypothetical protein
MRLCIQRCAGGTPGEVIASLIAREHARRSQVVPAGDADADTPGRNPAENAPGSWEPAQDQRVFVR